MSKFTLKYSMLDEFLDQMKPAAFNYKFIDTTKRTA